MHLQPLTLAVQCLHGLAEKAGVAGLVPLLCGTRALAWEPLLLEATPCRDADESLCCFLPYYVVNVTTPAWSADTCQLCCALVTAGLRASSYMPQHRNLSQRNVSKRQQLYSLHSPKCRMKQLSET